MESVTIQVCQVDDAPRLAPLVASLAREEGTDPVEAPRLIATIQRLIETRASDFLLATRDDQPVGCVQISWRLSTWHGGPYAYLEDVYVVPESRSRGIGRRMLLEAAVQAEARGVEQMMLDVRTENSAAQRLYEHLGFKTSSSILMKCDIVRHIVTETH